MVATYVLHSCLSKNKPLYDNSLQVMDERSQDKFCFEHKEASSWSSHMSLMNEHNDIGAQKYRNSAVKQANTPELEMQIACPYK